MHPPPACRSPGPQCHAIEVTLRVAKLDRDDHTPDHEATWLLGHTQRISFGSLQTRGAHLEIPATLHVRCRHLALPDRGSGAGGACRAHGFIGIRGPTPPHHQPRRLGEDRFALVIAGRLTEAVASRPRGTLPVLPPGSAGDNPCASAPCTTADHVRGSACCRDLQIEILCRESETELEALIRSRLPPYLCKLTRESPESIGAELISACAFLDDSGRGCSLHDRTRPDGRPAKPDLCSQWPDDGKGVHPGCIFK